MDRWEELALAKSHVELGERLVGRQRDLIARLSAQGHGVYLAHALLDKLEVSLVTLRDHLDMVQRELDEEAKLAQPLRPEPAPSKSVSPE